jgi:hypothetical protein
MWLISRDIDCRMEAHLRCYDGVRPVAAESTRDRRFSPSGNWEFETTGIGIRS